ncbi:MAG: M20/M25/M40 family metallo-hydrolase [Methanomassiliicoccales archaeon]
MDREETVELLRHLVSIDSVNPSLCPHHRGEGELASYLESLLKEMGLRVEKQPVAGGRHNVIARMGQGERRLLLVSHMDTVEVDSMTIPPFDPLVKGNRLYGRGSADTKGGMAAVVSALDELDPEELEGEVVFAATVDEEFEALGAERLMDEVGADGAVVMEPVGLRAVVAHKGFMWQEFSVAGRAAHGSDTSLGVDAIMRAGLLLRRLSDLGETVMRRRHPYAGSPSLHASRIEGGEGWSSYPSSCRLEVERRTIPGEGRELVANEFSKLVEGLRSSGVEVSTRSVFFREGSEVSPGEEVVVSLLQAAHGLGVDCPLGGMSAWPEAGVFNLRGLPAVVFGPGGCTGHEADEHVDIDSVITCSRVLRSMVREFLAPE